MRFTLVCQLSYIFVACCFRLTISFQVQPKSAARICRTYLRMVSRINDYANITRNDLIFNNIQRDIESELTRTLTTLLDKKFTDLSTDFKNFDTKLSAEIKNLDTEIKNLDTKLSTEIKNFDTKFSTEIKSLESKISPLSVIYTALVFSGGGLFSLVWMYSTKIDWSSVVFKN